MVFRPRHARWFTPLFFASALVGASSYARIERSGRPPNSLRPPAERRPVRVLYAHERVRQCKRVTIDRRHRCIAELEPADTSATVTFELVTTPSTVAGDTGSPLVVQFPSRLGPQDASVELALGQWLVDWRGRGCANLTILPTTSAVVSLEATTGRCEFRGGQCRHNPDAVSQQMTISDERR